MKSRPRTSGFVAEQNGTCCISETKHDQKVLIDDLK